MVCSENGFGFDIASKTMPQRIATTAATICPASFIVYRAHDDDYQRAQQNAEHRRRHVDKYEQRQHKADEYGKSAHAGDRVVMHTALVLRDVYRADLFSKALDRRRHQERHNRRDDYGHQQLEPQ